MTEQAGHLNASDLVEECARANFDAWREIEGSEATWDDVVRLNSKDGYANAKRAYLRTHNEVKSVLSVLRKRGLLTIQALELLADK